MASENTENIEEQDAAPPMSADDVDDTPPARGVSLMRRRGAPQDLSLDDEDFDDDDDDSGDDDGDDDNDAHFARSNSPFGDPRRGFDRSERNAPEAPTLLPEDRAALQEASRDQLFVPPPDPPDFAPAPRRRGRPPSASRGGNSQADMVRDRIESLRLTQAEEAVNRQKALQDEFYDSLAALDFGSAQHRFAVARLSPEYDTLTGKRIAGHLETFPYIVTIDEIRQKYGGGKYQLTVMGPRPTGTGVVMKAKRTVDIAGDPIVPEDPRLAMKNAKQKESEEASHTLELVKSLVEAKDKDVNRAYQEARETKQLLLQTLAAKNETSSAGLKDILATLSQTSAKEKETLLEERRLQEERARKEMEARQEERRLQEERLKQEREERRQELEMLRLQQEKTLELMRMENQRILAETQAKAARDAEASREMFLAMQKMEAEKAIAAQRAEAEKSALAQQQHEKMLEMMRLENQRILAELQMRSSKESESSKEMLVFMQKMEAEKAAQAQRQQEFALQQQMQNQQMLLQQMQQIDQTKTSILMEALKEAKSRTDDTTGMLEKLVAMKQAFSSLTSEPDDREPYEKFLDKAGEMAPGLLAAISSMKGSQGQAAPVQSAAPAQPRVAPNSIAVVDLPSEPPRSSRALPPAARNPGQSASAGVKKKPKLPKRPPAEEATQASVVRQNPATPPAQTAQKAPQAQEETSGTTDLNMTDFVFPQQGDDLETSIKLLVQNIEFAMQQDLDTEAFYETVAKKFPLGVLSLLKLTTADKCVEILEQLAPADWMINTPAGTQYVENLHDLLTSK